MKRADAEDTVHDDSAGVCWPGANFKETADQSRRT